MKKIFYFSEKNLKFEEIKNFNRKTVFSVVISSTLISTIIFVLYFFIHPIFQDVDKEKLLLENQELKSEIKKLNSKYASLLSELNELGTLSNKLRSTVNLQPINAADRVLGKGGTIISSELLDNLKISSDVKESLNAIEQIVNRFEFEKSEYKILEKKINENQKFFESLPVLIPTEGEFSIEGFGMRLHPILKIVRMHEGVDILNDPGTPVYSPGAGKVTYVGRRAGLGITLEIEHGFGYKTVYGHLSKILVKEGQTISRGDKIALTGNTGLSTGPHLHYEVHFNGVPQDPMNYFLENSKTYLAEKSKNKLGGK